MRSGFYIVLILPGDVSMLVNQHFPSYGAALVRIATIPEPLNGKYDVVRFGSDLLIEESDGFYYIYDMELGAYFKYKYESREEAERIADLIQTADHGTPDSEFGPKANAVSEIDTLLKGL